MSSNAPTTTSTRSLTDVGSQKAVGVDLGVRNLLAAAPADAGADVDDAVVVDGTLPRLLFEELGAITTRMQATEHDTRQMEARVFVRYRDCLLNQFRAATVDVWHYLDSLEAKPVVVLEDLGHPYRPLRDCRRADVDVATWLIPAFQRFFASATRREGYTVEFVDPHNTTQECHVCGNHGLKWNSSQLRCETDDCPVDDVCRDRSAAATIAARSSVPTASRSR